MLTHAKNRPSRSVGSTSPRETPTEKCRLMCDIIGASVLEVRYRDGFRIALTRRTLYCLTGLGSPATLLCVHGEHHANARLQGHLADACAVIIGSQVGCFENGSSSRVYAFLPDPSGNWDSSGPSHRARAGSRLYEGQGDHGRWVASAVSGPYSAELSGIRPGYRRHNLETGDVPLARLQ